MNDLLKAYATKFASDRPHGGFTMKYRSKKAPSESIVIHNKHWKGSGIFHPTFFGCREPIRASEPLPDKLGYDCRLQKLHLGEWVLSLPLDAIGCAKG